jgi:plasmid stability protein
MQGIQNRCNPLRAHDIVTVITSGVVGMGQVIVRNLEDDVIEQHRARAKARGVSLEQELREVLRRAARPSKEELLAEMDRCRAMTPALPPGVKRIAAEDIIREIRDTE